MDDAFLITLQKLELIAFFSGYPVVYTVMFFFAGISPVKKNFVDRVISLLPFSYALLGTLFLGFEIKKIFPDYSIENIKHTIQQPYLVMWGLLSLLFWIPAISKKPILSLVHSLVFFFLLLSDLYLQWFSLTADNYVIKNDMKVYANSLILNLASFAILVLLSLLFSYSKRRPQLFR